MPLPFLTRIFFRTIFEWFIFMNENGNENNIIFEALQNRTQKVLVNFKEIKLICGLI